MKKFLFFLLTVLLWSGVYAQSGSGDFDTLFTAKRTVGSAAANPQLQANGITNFLLGKNYRPEWTTPVTVPLLHLKTDFGGLTIDKPGGGKQTHSLHLKDKQDRSYALRSVKKYPEKALPPQLTHTIAQKIVESEISASYPFGVLSVAPLSKAAGVPYFKNKLVYLDQNTLLGNEYKEYADALYLLELRQVVTAKGKEVKTYSTNEMVQKLQESGKNTVDETALLRARLLDNFIMDFDRHEGQFDWATRDSSGFTVFYPLPGDRDQAFFNSEGLFPSILRKMQAFHQLQGLHPQTKHVSTFNFAARNLDRAFLTVPDKQTWITEIDRFLKNMTDPVIEDAMAQQPNEVEAFSAEKIASILKKKRDYFKKDMLNYYDVLARRVTITGTNKREQFDVSNNADGSLLVTVHNLTDDGKLSYETYRRSFDPEETKEVQLYGLEGDDRFIIHGDASKIKIRLVGGPGDDEFINEGRSDKVWVYDVNYEHNTVKGTKMHQWITSNPMNNEYRRLGFGFNSSSPTIAVDYSTDGGLFLGPGWTMLRHGFRKDPYSSKQTITIARAINSSSYQLRYNAEFIELIGNEDVLLHAGLQLPTSRTRFYGYGNNTVNLFERNKGQYYLARYIQGDVSALLQHHFTSWLQMQYGPIGQFLKLPDERNNGKYISAVFPNDEGEVGLTKGKWYAGGQVSAQVNTRNDAFFPTQGTAINLYVKRLQDVSDHTGGFTEVGGAASFYTDFIYRKHVVLATSFGAAHNNGTFSFPQAQYLGFNQNLRGFRMQRFAGRTRAYNNTELRLNFGMLNLYILKGPFGVLGFHDIGRVWTDGETSSTWHRGYGGGLWMEPFDKLLVSGVLSYSNEERNYVVLKFGFAF